MKRRIKLMKRADGTLMNTDDDVAENFLYGPTAYPKLCAKVEIEGTVYNVFLPINRQLLEDDPDMAERLLTEAAERFDPAKDVVQVSAWPDF